MDSIKEPTRLANLAEELFLTTLFRADPPKLPEDFGSQLYKESPYFDFTLLALSFFYPEKIADLKENLIVGDTSIEYEHFMRKAIEEKEPIFALMSLFHEDRESIEQAFSPAMQAISVLSILALDNIPPVAKFMGILFVSRIQCFGSITDARVAAAVTESVLWTVNTLPIQMVKEVRFFMDCNILKADEFRYYFLSVIVGLVEPRKASLAFPITANDHLNLMTYVYDKLRGDYAKGIAFASFSSMIINNSNYIADELAKVGITGLEKISKVATDPSTKELLVKYGYKSVEIGQTVGTGVYNVANSPVTRSAVAAIASGTLGAAGIGARIAYRAGTFVLRNIWIGATDMAEYGWDERINTRIVNWALAILVSIGEIKLSTTVRRPALGSATIHAMAEGVDRIIECKDDRNVSPGSTCILPNQDKIQGTISRVVQNIASHTRLVSSFLSLGSGQDKCESCTTPASWFNWFSRPQPNASTTIAVPPPTAIPSKPPLQFTPLPPTKSQERADLYKRFAPPRR